MVQPVLSVMGVRGKARVILPKMLTVFYLKALLPRPGLKAQKLAEWAAQSRTYPERVLVRESKFRGSKACIQDQVIPLLVEFGDEDKASAVQHRNTRQKGSADREIR